MLGPLSSSKNCATSPDLCGKHPIGPTQTGTSGTNFATRNTCHRPDCVMKYVMIAPPMRVSRRRCGPASFS